MFSSGISDAGQVSVINKGFSAVTQVQSSAAISGRNVADRETTVLSEQAKQMNESESVYRMGTGSGDRDIDLEVYFSPKASQQTDLFDTSNLLLPSSQNVAAIQSHINEKMPSFLARNDIPEAPEFVRYDGHGNMVLPADYAYADKFKEALAEEPGLAKAMSTVNALASHVAALKELEPFHQEMEAADSEAQIKAIIDKYSHLLSDNRSYPQIELVFTTDGRLSVEADGTALV